METVVELPDTLKCVPVELYISSDREEYRFGYYVDEIPVEVGKGKTKLLSTEVNWGFTGVMVGMYATGNGKAAKSPAKFKWFRYRGERGN